MLFDDGFLIGQTKILLNSQQDGKWPVIEAASCVEVVFKIALKRGLPTQSGEFTELLYYALVTDVLQSWRELFSV